MAASSKAQAKLFRVAKAVKNRELNPHDASQRAVDIARTVQSHKIDNYAETDDTHLPERVPPKLKEYDQGPYPSNGNNVMGSLGDASFIGPDGIRKGAAKKPVYKTPKSSIHYKKGRFPNEPDFYDEDNWETDEVGPSTDVSGKKSYIGDKSTPKNSIHYGGEDYDEDRKNTQTMEQLGIPMSADGVIDGGPRKRKKLKMEDNDITIRFNHGRMVATFDNKEDLDNWIKKSDLGNEEYMYTIHGHGGETNLEKYKKSLNDSKDYDTNVVPNSSIHYGERDKVKGEPKMKFEKVVKAGFVPDEIKNLTTQGDWKNNLTKAVMDLTGEAQPKEPITPVPQKPIGDTPEFPFASDEGTSYPIPGGGLAVKKNGEWTFGDTPELPAASQAAELGSACQMHGEPSANMIDIPCSKRPLIKKLMMFIKKEQSNLHEGIALKGEYNGKIVKLNTIYEGVERRFKTYVKNEGKILEIHFGPKKNEDCGINKKKSIESDNELQTEGIGKNLVAAGLMTLFTAGLGMGTSAQSNPNANNTKAYSTTQSMKTGNSVTAKSVTFKKNDNGTYTATVIATDGNRDITKSATNKDFQRAIDMATMDARAEFALGNK